MNLKTTIVVLNKQEELVAKLEISIDHGAGAVLTALEDFLEKHEWQYDHFSRKNHDAVAYCTGEKLPVTLDGLPYGSISLSTVDGAIHSAIRDVIVATYMA